MITKDNIEMIASDSANVEFLNRVSKRPDGTRLQHSHCNFKFVEKMQISNAGLREVVFEMKWKRETFQTNEKPDPQQSSGDLGDLIRKTNEMESSRPEYSTIITSSFYEQEIMRRNYKESRDQHQQVSDQLMLMPVNDSDNARNRITIYEETTLRDKWFYRLIKPNINGELNADEFCQNMTLPKAKYQQTQYADTREKLASRMFECSMMGLEMFENFKNFKQEKLTCEFLKKWMDNADFKAEIGLLLEMFENFKNFKQQKLTCKFLKEWMDLLISDVNAYNNADFKAEIGLFSFFAKCEVFVYYEIQTDSENYHLENRYRLSSRQPMHQIFLLHKDHATFHGLIEWRRR